MSHKTSGITLKKPINLNYVKLVEKAKTEHKIPGINPDKLAWVIHTIYDRIMLNKDSATLNCARLHSTILKSYLGDSYSGILLFLEQEKIIEIDHSYQVKSFTKGYFLNDEYYFAEVERYVVQEKNFVQKIKKHLDQFKRHRGQSAVKKMNHWLTSGNLKMDFAKATAITMNMYKDRLLEIEKSDVSDTKKSTDRQKLKRIRKYYELVIMDFKDIQPARRDFESTYRVYSVMTRLLKMLRPTVHYNGKELYQIDLTVSQLFFSLLLMNENTWKGDKRKDRTFGPVWKNMKCKTKNPGEIKLRQILEMIRSDRNGETDVFKSFRNDVLNGEFYEKVRDVLIRMEAKCISGTSRDLESLRNIAKGRFLSVLFDDTVNRYYAYNSEVWKAFRAKYPGPERLFDFIKQNNYADLAYILQRIESIVMVDNVCVRLAQELPTCPFFLIHDCIVTTKGYTEKVGKLMTGVINEIIGYEPKYDSKSWSHGSESSEAPCIDEITELLRPNELPQGIVTTMAA